jgi:hypothetical protein
MSGASSGNTGYVLGDTSPLSYAAPIRTCWPANVPPVTPRERYGLGDALTGAIQSFSPAFFRLSNWNGLIIITVPVVVPRAMMRGQKSPRSAQ